MLTRLSPWCGLGAALILFPACSSYEPIVYTERVPYEWELEEDAGAPDAAAANLSVPAASAAPMASAAPQAPGSTVGASGPLRGPSPQTPEPQPAKTAAPAKK